MAQLDDALDGLQEALDDQDIKEICVAARIVLAICGILEPDAAITGLIEGHSAGRAHEHVFDPDELGLEPEEFDVAFWRKAVS